MSWYWWWVADYIAVFLLFIILEVRPLRASRLVRDILWFVGFLAIFIPTLVITKREETMWLQSKQLSISSQPQCANTEGVTNAK